MSFHRIYDQYFDIDQHNPRICELTGQLHPDIHHIDARGMGGRTSVDVIENLMALNRVAHDYFGDKEQFMEFLILSHELFMEDRIPFYKRKNALLDDIFLHFITISYKSVRFLY